MTTFARADGEIDVEFSYRVREQRKEIVDDAVRRQSNYAFAEYDRGRFTIQALEAALVSLYG